MNIAIIRGPNLNKFEMQNYEPLAKRHSLTAYTTYNHNFEIDKIAIPVRKLHCCEEWIGRLPFPLGAPFLGMLYRTGYNQHMFGLEEELKAADIAHVAETVNGYSYQAIRAKERYGVKVVVTVWENIPFKPVTPFPRFLDNRRLRDAVRENADAFVAITERAKTALLLEGVPKEKIHVIAAGVDLARFTPRDKNRALLIKLGLDENDFVILFIGRLTWEKGIYDLMYAAKMCQDDPELRGIPLKFLFVGAGREAKGMMKEAEKLRIVETVKFMNSVPYHEIDLLHNIADIFVLASKPTLSWQEQFGMVLAEALASGNAVISTLSGSIPEVVGDAGILVQPGDCLSLYREIKRLVLDRKLREELGEKARRRAEEEFDCKKIAEKIGELYESVTS
jgi:starch synthase